MTAKETKAILRFLLSVVAPNEMTSDFNMDPKALAWLEKILAEIANQGMWETEMQKYMAAPENMMPKQLQGIKHFVFVL